MLPRWTGGNHVTNLDFPIGNDHPIHQQLDQLSLLLEGRLRQPHAYAFTELFNGGHHARHFRLPIHLPLQVLLLGGECLLPLLDLAASSLILVERNHGAQVGFG